MPRGAADSGSSARCPLQRVPLGPSRDTTGGARPWRPCPRGSAGRSAGARSATSTSCPHRLPGLGPRTASAACAHRGPIGRCSECHLAFLPCRPARRGALEAARSATRGPLGRSMECHLAHPARAPTQRARRRHHPRDPRAPAPEPHPLTPLRRAPELPTHPRRLPRPAKAPGEDRQQGRLTVKPHRPIPGEGRARRRSGQTGARPTERPRTSRCRRCRGHGGLR